MPEYSFILAGRVGVGKSSLFRRLQYGMFSEFTEDRLGTRRFDMGLENLVYETNIEGKEVKVTLWDTGGLERYDSMTANYYRFCHAVILVYDLEAEETLYCLKDWMSEAKRNCRWPEKMVFSLWGNKCDLDEQDTEKLKEAIDAFVTEHNISLEFQVSAKTGENVEEAFLKVIEAADEQFNNPNLSDLSVDPRDTAVLGFSDSNRAFLHSPRRKMRCCRTH